MKLSNCRLWLNEAFATYMSTMASWEVVESKKKAGISGIQYKNEYFVDKLKSGLISGAIYKPGRPFANSLRYVYQKGAYFLWMLDSVMGEDGFQKAIRSYLNKHKFSSVDHKQLWASLEEESPFSYLSIAEVFDGWITRHSVPIVTVSRRYTEGHKTQITLKQKPDNEEPLYIPIFYTIFQFDNDEVNIIDTNKIFWMDPSRQEVVMQLDDELVNSRFAILVNFNKPGMYHVRYDEENWKAIWTVLMRNPHVIPPAARVQLFYSLGWSFKAKEIRGSLLLCFGEYVEVFCSN